MKKFRIIKVNSYWCIYYRIEYRSLLFWFEWDQDIFETIKEAKEQINRLKIWSSEKVVGIY